MYEDVLTTGCRCNEAEALSVVEEFYCSLLHGSNIYWLRKIKDIQKAATSEFGCQIAAIAE